MGCGSSTLKGEKVEEVAPQPIKKVRTNFSDVDFSGVQGQDSRRPTLAVAPDEQRRPTKISETADEGSLSANKATPSDGIAASTLEPQLEPYRSIEGDHGLASPSQEPAHPTLPRSGPDSAVKSEGLNPEPSSSEPRRKSWIDRVKDHGRDKSMEISDEELKKQTGMTRAEFEEYKKNPQNRVGAHQKAKDQGAFGGLSGVGAGTMGM